MIRLLLIMILYTVIVVWLTLSGGRSPEWEESLRMDREFSKKLGDAYSNSMDCRKVVSPNLFCDRLGE